MSSPSPTPLTQSQEWDQLRTAFASSIMVDTSLASLAVNLDGPAWPFTGENETPAGYIDFTFAELVAEFTGRGQPGAAELLLQILRDTLAFDQPFGEMVKQTEAFAERDNPMLRSLGRLGIPESFPLELTTLDDPARTLCRLENVSTIGEFALFAQRLSQGIIIGGDLRKMLNALAHVDETALAELLPFRPGTTGLHLAEALIQAARHPLPKEQVARVLAWFDAEFSEWRGKAEHDQKLLPRQFAQLNDIGLEERISLLLAPHWHFAKPRRGFWASLFGRSD